MLQSRIIFHAQAEEKNINQVKELLCERGYYLGRGGTVLDKEGRPCHLPKSVAQEVRLMHIVSQVN